MRHAILWLLLSCFQLHAEVELLVVGDDAHPVKFVTLPFTYEGNGVSPAVTVENHLVQALSSTGLFSMPYRYEVPADQSNMYAWRLNDIRYVIEGRLFESSQMLMLRLTINDTLGLQPTLSTVVLNPKQLALSSQMFADQVYRSLFYATFTNDHEKQYLDNENPTLTRYLNQLVMTFKRAWRNNAVSGTCTVQIQQMPGGLPFKSTLQENCFISQQLAEEIEAALEEVELLPYENYQDVFERELRVEFISTL
ncbi:hypothetical protein ACFODZ_10125 [Marinicella sediminis]|uniref:Uncharacterized protein n=1 Tax=Marinicella sediminis TaxID=1792834 RepID=A0ABV7JGP9_9GAMM|nr:hypothetical protein [Marinicella sediminis]